MPVLLGVLPLHTARHAEFLHNEVPGITIPDERAAACPRPANAARRWGSRWASRCWSRWRGLVAGTYIMPSFGRYELAPSWCAASGRDAPTAVATSDESARGATAGSRRDVERPRSSARWRWLVLMAAAALGAETPPPGPPFPEPVNDLAVYDYAEVFGRRHSRARPSGSIDAIEKRTGAEVVVYTQFATAAFDEEARTPTPRRADGPVGRRPARASTTAW